MVSPVIEADQRAEYLDLLNRRDFNGLAELFKESIQAELDRLFQFQGLEHDD